MVQTFDPAQMPDSHLMMLFTVIAEKPGVSWRKKSIYKLRSLLDGGSSASFVRIETNLFSEASSATACVHAVNGAKQLVNFGQMQLQLGGSFF